MAELIEPHIPALRRFAWALLRDSQGADDLVQDCLERAVGRWSSRRVDGDVRAWMFTILHNCFISDRRRDKRRGAHLPLEGMPDEPMVEARQDAGLHYVDVVVALGELPDEQRSVLLLVGVEDMQYSEAARVLGVPIGTVMSRLSRGREKLRQLVAEERTSDRQNVRRIV